MKWFGESWGAPVCDPGEQVEAPVGARCAKCQGPIRKTTTRGILFPGPESVVFHLNCFLHEMGLPYMLAWKIVRENPDGTRTPLEGLFLSEDLARSHMHTLVAGELVEVVAGKREKSDIYQVVRVEDL